MAKSIETTIRVNVFLIYLLVALAFGGVFFYFYLTSKDIDLKRKTVEEYNQELTEISDLIHAVNEAQADVNLFVITQRRQHLRQYQERTKGINLRIDSLKTTLREFGADTILSQITGLLKQKEQSIILLNKQYTNRSPIDSLSHKLTTLSVIQQESLDTLVIPDADTVITPVPPAKKGLWKKFTGLFSSSSKNKSISQNPLPTVTIDTTFTAQTDTAEINQIIEQTRVNYDRHITAIERQINTVVMTDQFITTRITDLLTLLYNQVIHSRIEEINQSETILHQNNIRAYLFGGIALILILLFILLILRNVNKGQSVRQALEEANIRTRRLMESRHKLLLSVSHDVKTPLSSILGYIDLYERKGLLTTEEVGPIHNAGNHILSLLNNLLEFSSLEKGSVILAPHDFFPVQLVSELNEMFTPLAQKKSLRFDCRQNFPPDLAVKADCLRIKQILINILSNAVKYTIEGNILFEAFCHENKLEFRVTDTGVGIPADKMGTIYRPFSRIEENNILDEGSGFGLFVVKGLVDLLNGEIGFYSRQGEGTRVVIQFPVTPGKKIKLATSARNILLIDDDEIYLDMLAALCHELGHTTVTCKNQADFIQQMSNINHFDFVLTDMEMDNFNGKEVFEAIRKQNTQIPVILVSGRTDLSPETIQSEGFTDSLGKPVTLSDLHALIGGEISQKGEDILTGFLGHDREAVVEIMERFFMETVNHTILLKEAITDFNFEKAQSLCHKMLPMFVQTRAPEEMIRTMKAIDALRKEKNPEDAVWQQITDLTGQIEIFLHDIQEEYLS